MKNNPDRIRADKIYRDIKLGFIVQFSDIEYALRFYAEELEAEEEAYNDLQSQRQELQSALEVTEEELKICKNRLTRMTAAITAAGTPPTTT